MGEDLNENLVLLRLHELGLRYADHEALVERSRSVRDKAICEAHEMGLGYRKIGRTVGLTPARVHQIVKGAR